MFLVILAVMVAMAAGRTATMVVAMAAGHLNSGGSTKAMAEAAAALTSTVLSLSVSCQFFRVVCRLSLAIFQQIRLRRNPNLHPIAAVTSPALVLPRVFGSPFQPVMFQSLFVSARLLAGRQSPATHPQSRLRHSPYHLRTTIGATIHGRCVFAYSFVVRCLLGRFFG